MQKENMRLSNWVNTQLAGKPYTMEKMSSLLNGRVDSESIWVRINTEEQYNEVSVCFDNYA